MNDLRVREEERVSSIEERLETVERQVSKRVVIRAMPHYHPEQYEVYAR